MKINSRHYILILFAILSMIVSFSAYFFLYRQTTIQANKYLSARKQIEVEKSNVNHEETLLETFNKYEEQRKKISTYIVKEDDLVKFIERLEKIGTDAKSKLEISSIGKTDNKIRAKITAEGGWQSIMTTLMMIEDLPVSMLVNNVRIDTLGGVEKTPSKTVMENEWRLSLDIEALTIN
jgi:hypothetical protein